MSSLFSHLCARTLPCTRQALVVSVLLLSACATNRPAAPSRTTDYTSLEQAAKRELGSMHNDEQFSPPGAQPDSTPQSLRPLLLELSLLFAQAQDAVAATLGVDLGDVALQLVPDEKILREVERETRRLAEHQFASPRFAAHFTRQMLTQQHGTYVGLYTSRSDTVMLSKRLVMHYLDSLGQNPSLRRSAILSLLIHELVHAADDRRYDIHRNRSLNFRASFAQSATFEGHAQFVTRDICQQLNCLDGLASLDRFMFGGRSRPNNLTQTVDAISLNILEYSYVEGERFITALSKRPDGRQLIDQLLSQPPADPIQILSPLSFPDTAREARNQQLVDAARHIDHPWLDNAWQLVEASPLRGVNLRADPARRQAAVDGFTRLVTAMVGLQLYDMDHLEQKPVDITILQTDTATTAALFADSLYRNALFAGALPAVDTVPLREQTSSNIMRHTTVEGAEPFNSTIAASGNYVVQISTAGKRETLQHFAEALLTRLQR